MAARRFRVQKERKRGQTPKGLEAETATRPKIQPRLKHRRKEKPLANVGGVTSWKLVRGSNVVRNLHLAAPLFAALANGDNTLSITATGRVATALLAYYTSASGRAVGRLPNGNSALLAYYTSAQVDALLANY